MSKSIYRRDAIGNFKSVFLGRYGMLDQQQHLFGTSIQSRTPAFIKITGKCNTCKGGGGEDTIPYEKNTWDETYKSSFKPSPQLKNVTISFAGDWGIAKKITATIKCFDIDSFRSVQKYFLTPGNFITATFGYAPDRWNPPDEAGDTLTGFRVATFSFTAGDGGTWEGTFTAVSAGEAIKSLDIHGGINNLNNIKYKVGGEDRIVSGIAELIASDAQRNGAQKINIIKENTSGYVIAGVGEFQDYEKTPDSEVDAGMVIYVDNHLRTPEGNAGSDIWKFFKQALNYWDDATDSVHEIYVTLGYVVDRIVNGQVKKTFDANMTASPTDVDYTKLKIRFDSELSRSSLPKFITSGDPTSVLILGSTKCKYLDIDTGNYMDFNELKGGSNHDLVKAWDGKVLRLDRILLHRAVILSALSEATSERPTESETVDPKDAKDTVVNLNDFFQSIFSAIKACTGGAVSPKLVIDPKDEKGFTYLVVDQNYAGEIPIECYIFNPIDGDGNTRECNISSNGGSNEYRTSMFIGNSKKGDVAAKLRDCEDELKAVRRAGFINAEIKYLDLIQMPGKIMKDHFNSKQMGALMSVMVDFYRYAEPTDNKKENINWPGMEIDITINGTYGIIPGCAISTTQLPSEWLGKGVYFMVREVTHNFQNSDWSTNIRGIMALYDYLKPIRG